MRALRLITLVAVVVALSLGGAQPPARAAQDSKLVTQIRAVLKDSRVQRAKVGVVVRDAGSGEYLYRRSSTSALIPASNMKLVTAGAAMVELGPDYRFHTDVRGAEPTKGVVAGNLYLKGYGDPTTRLSDYRSLAAQLSDRGVRRVSGKIVADATWFDEDRYHDSWSTGYADRWYGAEVSALTFASNADYDPGTIMVTFKPAKKSGSRAVLSTYPAAAKKVVTIKNLTRTTSTGYTTISVSRAYGSNTIVVRGSIRKGASSGSREITVGNPKKLAAATFRGELAKVGITVDGSTSYGTMPSGLPLLARDRSMSLASMLKPFLKLSNNGHAEALVKAMGREASGVGTWSAGLARTRAFLESAGVDTSTVRLVDGSGLARANKLTAVALSRVLVHVRDQSWFSAYYAALPVAGVSTRSIGGTLRYRMNNTAADGNARGKTGTLTGVTSLSGYVRDRDGRLYVYVMISNYSGSSPRPVEDRFVVALARHRR